MKKAVLAVTATMALAGCGTQMGDRLASGGMIGLGVGAVAGAAVPGAVIGAAVGGLVPPDKINLGEPLWR